MRHSQSSEVIDGGFGWRAAVTLELGEELPGVELKQSNHAANTPMSSQSESASAFNLVIAPSLLCCCHLLPSLLTPLPPQLLLLCCVPHK